MVAAAGLKTLRAPLGTTASGEVHQPNRAMVAAAGLKTRRHGQVGGNVQGCQ